MRKTLLILAISVVVLSGCALKTFGPNDVVAEYSYTPTEGIMGGIETKYIFYGDGTYKHYEQGKEAMNYGITLTEDELNYLKKSPNDKKIVQDIVNSVYKRELEAWEKQKGTQN